MSNPFANWTERDVFEHQARVNPKREIVPCQGEAVEADLHAKIFDECRRRGWIAFHGSMAERTHRNEGEPDFHIWTDGGKSLAVECKSRTGKLSVAQQAMIAHAAKLGHTIHVVRSFEAFLKLI